MLRCYVWLDICTVAQHPSAQMTLPEGYFYTQFRAGIEQIGCTVLVLAPLLEPIPLTRSWRAPAYETQSRVDVS